MAKVSISEAARLVGISRPTIYKMLNSGQLNFTSTVKAGKSVKIIDTSELIRVFGAIENMAELTTLPVNSVAEHTLLNSSGLQDLQHEIELLKKENEGLRESVASRDDHISSLRQAMLLLEHKKDTQNSISKQESVPWWRFWQKSK